MQGLHVLGNPVIDLLVDFILCGELAGVEIVACLAMEDISLPAGHLELECLNLHNVASFVMIRVYPRCTPGASPGGTRWAAVSYRP
jgi:hypothetical protein